MKEFASTTGGRHVYNSDFKNLQELALAMQELFRECGGNFVISGCKVTISDSKVTVSSGYVYINGKVRAMAEATDLSAANLYIVGKSSNGVSIPYADGSNFNQYTDYYAKAVNSSSVSDYIAYDTTLKAFPNIATIWFNNYAVTKNVGKQAIEDLSVTSLNVSKELNSSEGVVLGDPNYTVKAGGDYIEINSGTVGYKFLNDGTIKVYKSGELLFSFSNGSGEGTVTYSNVTVTEELKTKKLTVSDVDIMSLFAPLGVIQIWTGKEAPDNYKLCNGQTLKISDYQELYNVIGTKFNRTCQPDETAYPEPNSGYFRLPDLRRRFVVGSDNDTEAYNVGKTGGANTVLLSAGQSGLRGHCHDMTHTHQYNDYYNLFGGSETAGGGGYKVSGTTKTTEGASRNNTGDVASQDAIESHENRPPFYALSYIIRVK